MYGEYPKPRNTSVMKIDSDANMYLLKHILKRLVSPKFHALNDVIALTENNNICVTNTGA